MANIQWETGIRGTLFESYIEPLENAASSIEATLSPLQTILSIIQSILKIIRVFIIDASSLLLAVTKALVEEITSFIRSLANAGIHILIVGPDTSNTQNFVNSVRGGFQGFLDKAYNSFFDASDPQRPIYNTNTPVGGTVLVATSGNLMDCINLLALIARGFKNIYQSLFVPPVIYGVSGNNVNLVMFETADLPGNLFSSFRYVIQRSEVSGGVPVKESPSSNQTSNQQTLPEAKKNSSTYTEETTYETIYAETFSALDVLIRPKQLAIIDKSLSEDVLSPQLVKIDLSERANVRFGSVVSAEFLLGNNLGPSQFNLYDTEAAKYFLFSGNLRTKFSTLDQIKTSISDTSAGSDFKSKYIGNNWIDFRINGISIPNSGNEGDLYVQRFEEGVVTLSQPVPLGSRVEAWSYVQSTVEVQLLSNNFNAGFPSWYTKKITPTPSTRIENGKTYYYRVLITSEDGETIFAKSNEIRLTPKLDVAPNSQRAYCVSSKREPFFINLDNNFLNFNVGDENFQINLRPNRKNLIAETNEIFQNSYGTLLRRDISSTSSLPNSSDAIIADFNNVFSGTSNQGLQFEYFTQDGIRQIILPGGFIPVDAENVILDLESQCNNPNVRFSITDGRIMIQDVSGTKASKIIFNEDNTALGFQKGVCMSVIAAEPPNWNRYAVKDFIPVIYDVAELIESLANGLISSLETGVKALVDFIDLISIKIKVLQDFLKRIEDLTNLLRSFRISLPNLYALRIPIVMGSTAFAETMYNATFPEGAEIISSVDDFACGLVFLTGGADATAVTPLLHSIL
jgi:hypothetical protein